MNRMRTSRRPGGSSRKRKSHSVASKAGRKKPWPSCGRRDPSLTQQEALARIVEELRELRERSADHEDQLTGLKSYGDMARLNPAGLTGIARPGSGLSESSDLSRALEGAWDVDDDDVHAARCDQAALGKFSGVARKHPTFPVCSLRPRNLRFK